MVIGGARERRLFGDRCSILCVVVDSWPGELSCGNVFSGGPWLLDRVACRTCVFRNAGEALVELRSEEERCR